MLLWVHLCLCSAMWQLENISTDNLQLQLKQLDQPTFPNDEVLYWTEVSQNTDLNSTEIIREVPAALHETIESANPNEDTLNVTFNGELTYELGKISVNEYTAGRNETDDVMQQLQYYYLNVLPDEEDDNINYYGDINPDGDNSIKFGMSVIVQFLLEFYRIFRKSSTQSTHTQLNAIDVYGLSYDKAIHVMKAKKEYVPLEIRAPLGQSTDILKSILHKFVQMVQMECKEWTMNWQSIILYLADLISDSMNCPNIWYNFVHIMLLRAKTGIHETFAYKIAELANFKELANYQNIFEFVIEKLVEYREVGRVQLSAEAVILTMLADMQENGLLNCVSVKNDYSR